MLAAVRSHGRTGAAVRAAADVAHRAEPFLAAELRDAQLMAFLTPWPKYAKYFDPPRKAAPLPPPAGPEPRGTVFPQVVKAAEWVRSRIPFEPAEYRRLEHDARQVAVTVARAQTLDVVKRVREAIAEDVAEGGTLAGFRERVGEALEASGAGPAEVEAVYRTHVGRAYAAGQVAVLDSPAVRSAVPYLLYSATHDDRTRPEHLEMERLGLDGTAVYRADDPVWDFYFPPWGWNSVVGGTVVQGRVRRASKARYAGDVLQLVTKGGRRLTVTPDHPVLTARGFEPAKCLRVGKNLLGYHPAPVGGGLRPDDDVDQPPARIDDLFDALRRLAGRVPVEGLPLYFDGDPQCGYGKIEVVPADSVLGDNVEADRFHRGLQLSLTLPGLYARILSALSPLVQSLGVEQAAALALRAFGEWATPEPCDPAPLRVGPAANLYLRRDESGAYRSPADAELFRQLQLRHPGQVVTDELIRVDVQHYRGPVYDVQTETGYMVAGGIVAANCRCVVVPLSARQAAGYGVREAREWVRTGRPPRSPEYVRPIPFPLPAGWVPTGRRLVPLG